MDTIGKTLFKKVQRLVREDVHSSEWKWQALRKGVEDIVSTHTVMYGSENECGLANRAEDYWK